MKSINDRVQEVLEYIKANPGCTKVKLEKAVGHRTGLQHHISQVNSVIQRDGKLYMLKDAPKEAILPRSRVSKL